jgi:hypothetical protein
MEGFQTLSEVDLFVPELTSDAEITIFSKLDNAEFVVDMMEEEQLKGY